MLIDELWEGLREIIYSTDPVKEVDVCVCVVYVRVFRTHSWH